MGLSGVRSLLGRLAAGAPVPVFVLVGRGGEALAEGLDRMALDPRLRRVDSPRQANVLLVAGCAASRLLRPALRVHDQMSRPRTTVWWLPAGERTPADLRLARRLGLAPDGLIEADGVERAQAADLVAEVIVRLHRELLTGARASEPAVLPDEEPAPWRGVGPFGQGGKGMMGGVPYGRPMAMRGAELRDGLELDRLPVRLGPFFPPLATGLALDVALQGDVIQEVTVGPNPFDRPAWRAERTRRGWDDDPFARALLEPVPVARLELARARHHLRWLARVLALHGLDTLGLRVLRLSLACAPGAIDTTDGAISHDLEPTRQGVGSLARRLRSRINPIIPPWGLAGATRCVGRVAPDRLDGLAGLGPVARAAGRPEDARSDDPVYRALGFEPIAQGSGEDGDGGDAWTRLLQRVAEAAQALDLVARAGRIGDPTIGGAGAAIEGPRGRLTRGGEPPSARLLVLVPELLEGLEWGDAVVALASLDLDLEEAGQGPLPGRAAGEREPRHPGRADRTHRLHRTRRRGEAA